MEKSNYDNFAPNADKVAAREASKKKSYNQFRPPNIIDVQVKSPAQRAQDRAQRSKFLAKDVNATFKAAKAQKLSRRDAAREIEQTLAEHLGYAESVSVSDVGVILDLPDGEVRRMMTAGKLEARNGRIDADSLVTYIAMAV